MQGVGRGRGQGQWLPLLAHRPCDDLEGGRPLGPHALRWLDPLLARLAEMVWRGYGAERVEVARESTGQAWTGAPQTTCQSDHGVGVTDGAEALGDRRTRPGEALVGVARSDRVLRHRRQAHGCLWRTTWPLREQRSDCLQRLGRGTRFGRPGGRADRAPGLRPRAHGQRGLRPAGLGHLLHQQARRCIAGRGPPLAREPRKRLR
jgi:hypothetical protein